MIDKATLVAWLEEEGFPGWAERLHFAEGDEARSLARGAAAKVREDGYDDSQARGTAYELEAWACPT